MLDLRHCPKTCATLERLGVVLRQGKPVLDAAWQEQMVPHLVARKAEHALRQERVKALCGESAVAFLGWVLLTDSWRHVRAEAVRGLSRQKTPAARALLTLGLADRSNLVVREARAQLGPESFAVVQALWEDRVAPETLLSVLQTLAKSQPTPHLRQMLPRLEREAKRFFLAPAYRRQLRETVTAIDEATAHLKDLPLTAMAQPDALHLPLPADPLQSPLPTRPWWAFWRPK